MPDRLPEPLDDEGTPALIQPTSGLDWLELLAVLREVYTPEGIGVWLFGAADIFGGRSALDLIRENRMSEVIERAYQLRDGAFA